MRNRVDFQNLDYSFNLLARNQNLLIKQNKIKQKGLLNKSNEKTRNLMNKFNSSSLSAQPNNLLYVGKSHQSIQNYTNL